MIIGAILGIIMMSLAIFGGYKLIEADQQRIEIGERK